MTLPKHMWDGIRFEVDPTIAAVSTLLVFLTVLMLSALVLAQRYLMHGQGGAGKGEAATGSTVCYCLEERL